MKDKTGRIQGIFYCLTGAWPLVHMSSFIAVTGAKHDLWLVRTMGLLLIGIGVALLVGERHARGDEPSANKQHVSPETFTLGLLTALILCGIELTYVKLGEISVVYLVDAVVEFVFIVAWLSRFFSWLVSRFLAWFRSVFDRDREAKAP